jgi:hypothetical protein
MQVFPWRSGNSMSNGLLWIKINLDIASMVINNEENFVILKELEVSEIGQMSDNMNM